MAHVKATDFIGRVETFEMDFSRFLSEVKIHLEQLVNENVVDLKGDSDSNPFGYRYVSRMNTRSKAKINDLFAKDFEIFGYQRQAYAKARLSVLRNFSQHV